tara:strand:- start:217 stop:2007 length:1791 start_codon:yes stop_codon:yes gene_type:complete
MGFILRLIAAINLSVSADDMHFVTHAINFLNSGKLVTYDQSSGLWFAFTDIMYNLFGMTQLASRMAPLLFGSLTIIVMYLFTKEFFGEKVSLISAFFLAIAPFHIKNTVAEMDVMTMFFVLLGFVLFLKAIKKSKNSLFIFSGIFIGLSIYTKVYPLLFIPSLVLYFIYHLKSSKKQVLTKQNLQKIFIFLAIIFIFTIPALSHNYLLYDDKGFLDLQFTRTLELGKETSAQYYSWDAQFEAKNSWKGLIFGDVKYHGSGQPLLLVAINIIRIGDPPIFYLGAIGLFFILFFRNKNKNYLIFFFLSILFVLPFLASIILLAKHFLFLEILLIPLGAKGLEKIVFHISKLKKELPIKLILIVILSTILIFSLIFLGFPDKATKTHFYGKSNIAQIIDFKEDKIPENSLIVQDSRIYRGRIHWTSQERFYLEGTDFIKFINSYNNSGENSFLIDVYYFECVVDDCGWGTIRNQPEFNQTMESLTNFFKERGDLVKTIKEPDASQNFYPWTSHNSKKDVINIYHSKLSLNSQILKNAASPKNWFLYNIGYPSYMEEFDDYNTIGFMEIYLQRLANFIKWVSLFLAFISPLYLIYLYNRQ